MLVEARKELHDLELMSATCKKKTEEILITVLNVMC